MKQINLLRTIFLAFVVIGMTTAQLGCKKGDVGPQGEQGIPGEDGADGDKGDKGDKGDTGSANVKEYEWKDNGLPGITFAAGAESSREFVFPLSISDFQNSVVLVYGEFGNGNSIQIPYVSKFYTFNASFLYSGTGTSDCTMRITKTAGTSTSSIRFIKIRVLVIPAASFINMSSLVDTRDYGALKLYLKNHNINRDPVVHIGTEAKVRN